MNHTPDNLSRFHAVAADLSLEQVRDASGHLLGAASTVVPAEDWDAMVVRAVAFATDSTAPRLGTPLVVFDATANCGTEHAHEVRLITSGTSAYAFGDDADAGPVLRTEGYWTATCQQPTADEPCHGEVEWSNAVGDWTNDTDALRTLVLHGAPVDRA